MSAPFGDQNPFADPAIQNATQNVQVTQKSLDDYNPFNTQNNYQPVINKKKSFIHFFFINSYLVIMLIYSSNN